MKLSRSAFVCVAFTAWLALAACSATPTTTTNAGAVGMTENFVVLGPAKERAVSSVDLEPTVPSDQTWTVRDAGGEAREVQIRTENIADNRVRCTDAYFTRVLTREANGSVLLIEQTDPRDGAVIRMSPPMVVAPGSLAPGQEYVAESDTRTWRGASYDGDGGATRRVVRNDGADRVRTPLGEFDAVRVQVEVTLKVSYASLRRDITMWVRPGFGPVATTWDEHVLVMGSTPHERGATMVRLPSKGNRP